MTHETLMSKIVKIFQGPTDGPTDRPTWLVLEAPPRSLKIGKLGNWEIGQKESDTSADTVLNADENIRPTVNIDMNNGRNTNKSILKQPNGISSHSQQILHARMMMS